MTDIVLPAALRQARSTFRYVDSTGLTRGVYTGVPQTTNYGGDRLGATIDFTPMGGKLSTDQSLRRQLISMLMGLRGKTNRIWLRDSSYVQGGSFPAPEMFTNADLSTTTGWSAGGTGVISATDGVISLGATGAGGTPSIFQPLTLTAYAPYAVRVILLDGLGTTGVSAGPNLTLSGTVNQTNYSTTRGYAIASETMHDASSHSQFPAVIGVSTGYNAQSKLSVLFASMARCFLVDGYPNSLLRSNAFATAPWSLATGTAAGNNGTAAPDGTLTAQYIQETDTTVREHYTSQTVTGGAAAATDYVMCCSAKANARSWMVLRLAENTSSTYAYVWFNVTTGVLGSTLTGANWANVRGTITDQGAGWFRCTIVARKTNAATSISGFVQTANADFVLSYAGTASTIPFLISEASLGPGSVATRATPTTSAAVAATSQTGTSIYVKGLPASTAGLLLAGDQVEIDGQIKFLTASLNSDAAGLGYLQFSPPLRRSVADNTPVIVCKPMGRFMLSGDSSGWNNDPGVFSTAALDLEEAFG